jgi:hypothetical protein
MSVLQPPGLLYKPEIPSVASLPARSNFHEHRCHNRLVQCCSAVSQKLDKNGSQARHARLSHHQCKASTLSDSSATTLQQPGVDCEQVRVVIYRKSVGPNFLQHSFCTSTCRPILLYKVYNKDFAQTVDHAIHTYVA